MWPNRKIFDVIWIFQVSLKKSDFCRGGKFKSIFENWHILQWFGHSAPFYSILLCYGKQGGCQEGINKTWWSGRRPKSHSIKKLYGQIFTYVVMPYIAMWRGGWIVELGVGKIPNCSCPTPRVLGLYQNSENKIGEFSFEVRASKVELNLFYKNSFL